MLKAENLGRKYTSRKGETKALSDITLEIGDGEFLCVTGPSGSGKSTLLLSLGGMNAPSEGKVCWNGESIYDWGLKRRAEWRGKTVGFVFQSFNLIPYLTVFENVSVALNLSGREIGNKSREDILNVLSRMQLLDRMNYLPRELSVGQQQRVALSRALVKNPQLILADEPTGNLDPDTAGEVLGMIREMHKEGRTVIMVTHNPQIAKMADRHIQIIEGKLKV